MLEGLDLVPWANLTHAYGEATDVPTVLRALSAGDPEALDALFGNIWHQGTVYPATAHAVPFLIELLQGPRTDVSGLLALLSKIATGSSYLDVHQSLMAPSQRPAHEEVDAELVWVRAAREAVRQGAPAYLRLLSHPEDEVRAASVYVLASCGAAQAAAGSLLDHGLRDPSGVVRASIVFALEEMARAGAVHDAWHLDNDPAVRVAMVLCCLAIDTPVTTRQRDVLRGDVPDALETLARVPRVADCGEPLNFIIDTLGDRWELERELLEAWMQHDRSEVREGAVFAAEILMVTSRPAARQLCAALAARLDDEEEGVRQWAATLLAQSGSAAAGAADSLWRALERGNPGRATVHAAALRALCDLKDPGVAIWLEQRLREAVAGEGTLEFVGEVIELLGPWAPGCLQPLIQLIPLAQQGNERIAVIGAVGGYGAAAVSAIPAIQAQLSVQPHIATRVLGDFGVVALPALNALRRMVGHEIEVVSTNAARAVFRIASDPEPAVGLISAAFEKKAASSCMLSLLAELGPRGASFASRLPPYFDSEDDWVSVKAAAAWWAVTGRAEPVLPTLLRHLVPLPRGFVAVRCLEAIGVEAHCAAPALRAFIESPLRQVRSGVASSLIAEDERWVEACQNALTRVTNGNP